MMKSILFFAAGFLLIRTGADVLIGIGCIVLSLLFIYKKMNENSVKYCFADSIDSFVLASIFAYWVENSLFLRAYLYCWYGWLVPLSGYRQVDFVIDAFFIEYFPEGYEICGVLRWVIIATVVLTLVFMIRASHLANKLYAERDQEEVDAFLRIWKPLLDQGVYSPEYANAYYTVSNYMADRIANGLGEAAGVFTVSKGIFYKDPYDSTRTLSEEILELAEGELKRRYPHENMGDGE